MNEDIVQADRARFAERSRRAGVEVPGPFYYIEDPAFALTLEDDPLHHCPRCGVEQRMLSDMTGATGGGTARHAMSLSFACGFCGLRVRQVVDGDEARRWRELMTADLVSRLTARGGELSPKLRNMLERIGVNPSESSSTSPRA